MALQLGALRDALLEAGATMEKAELAAEEVASYEQRIAVVDTRLTVLTWMVGTNIGVTLIVLGSTIALWAKFGELAGQLARVIR